ncbi:flagellar motor switch protein FliG [Gemmobacter fulvus]|uniref:Flagellar motor switch protein FliG n=1 Tax=Gemmobacter fulvus TaxID=2840474 RepID=A0A975P5D4_9RHOB|nr:FliG C-terminal domain-containing protein [Gemmobacter fulvus]MBT9247361.1 flagellar motor switch protein FliG [Gemmobacter fulvus]QWK90159.1 flagellar motor switch protein FliG [Gemmobacter fulvus]
MARALAQITPAQIAVPRPASGAVTLLSRRQKAAIIVRLMLAEGSPLPLSSLPDGLQAELAQQIGQMRLIDRHTLNHVVAEFLSELEQVGLSFPGGLEGALAIMDGHISSGTASRLRRLVGLRPDADPWDRLTALPPEALLPALEDESTEVAAVMLSKMPVAKAAALLGKLPGDKARRVAFAMSRTGNVDPGTVRRIGLSLLGQLDSQPPKAFEAGPVERVGAILNVSPELTREAVLQGLDEADAAFAEQVRKAIFTFTHLPRRLNPRDVPKVVRAVDQPTLVTALAGASGNAEREAAAEFILANMSQRMTQALREEIGARGKVKDKEAEAAMNSIIAAIRSLEADRELALRHDDEE